MVIKPRRTGQAPRPLAVTLPDAVVRVLFLPGASGQGAFWQPVADLLPSGWEKRCLDLPGLGDVPADPAVASFDDLADWVLGQVDGPVDLVAQSMGGVVAVRAALRRPAPVRRLVLVATSGGLDLAALGAEDWRAAYRARFPAAAPWVTADRAYLTAHIPSVATPTLLLWSDADPISPPAVGELLRDLLPNAELVVIPGGDHMFARDNPTVVAPHLERHLSRPSG
jgi:pimeloyl-ACP methyl ester carboxylesterase